MTATELDLTVAGFEERILFLRAVKLRLHGTQMAVLLGIPHATLKSWERKDSPSKPRDIVDIADRYVKVCAEAGLEVSADWILRGGAQLSSYLTDLPMPAGQMELPIDCHGQRLLDIAS